MSFTLKSAGIAVLAASLFAPVVLAQSADNLASTDATLPSETLYGGGATLPAIAYIGTSWLTANGTTVNNPVLRLSNPADTGSVFGEYTASTPPAAYKEASFPTVSYCQTGSGTGRAVLNGVNSADAGCGDYTTVPSPEGFSAPAATEANFAASDAPFAQSDYTTFINNKGATHTEPVQVPSIAGIIAIAYNNPDISASTHVSLTETQICQIFSGTINNWHQIYGVYPSRPIVLVTRSDSSGTSFNFSNHLSAVCPTAIGKAVSGFSTQSTFANAFPGGSAGAPAGSKTASGNGGVVTTIQNTAGAIGYAELEDAILRSTLSGSKINYASVKLAAGINPSTGKAYLAHSPLTPVTTFTLPSGAVKTDMVINGDTTVTSTGGGRPILQAVTAVPGVAGCVLIADPSSFASATLNSNGDYTRYPIVAVTYLLGYGTGNGANTNNLRSLFRAFSTAAVTQNVTTVGANTGFQYLVGVSPTVVSVATKCILK